MKSRSMKGFPGRAKARMMKRLRTEENSELVGSRGLGSTWSFDWERHRRLRRRSGNARFQVVGIDDSLADVSSLAGIEHHGGLLAAFVQHQRESMFLGIGVQDFGDLGGYLVVGLVALSC